jgi:prophage tail gpP-like protein
LGSKSENIKKNYFFIIQIDFFTSNKANENRKFITLNPKEIFIQSDEPKLDETTGGINKGKRRI